MARHPAAILAVLLAAAPAAALPEHLLTASDATSTDEFGWSVAASGYYAVVGAPRGIEPGSAYVYVRDGAGWSEQAILVPSISEGFDAYGMAVDVDGSTAVVAARGSGSSGRVFVFERTGAVWEETAIIDSEDVLIDPGEFSFGESVALSGDTLLISSNAHIYAFDRVGGDWVFDAEISSLGPPGALWRVALDGDRAIAGSLTDAAYAYERFNGGPWVFSAVLLTGENPLGTGFGRSVAIEGNRAVVGAPTAPSNGTEEGGAAFAYVRGAAGWVLEEKLEPLPPDVNNIHDYGWSVAMHAGRLAVGDNSDMEGGAGAGAVWLYARSGGAWSFDQRVVASDAEIFDRFAWSVALSPFALVVGAPEASENHFREGLAYAYDLPFVPPVGVGNWTLVAEILFGLVHGGGGVIILPGSGPVPIDPDPFLPPGRRPVFAVFTGDVAERDLLTEQIRLLWPDRLAVVDDALGALRLPDTLVLVAPADHLREVLALTALLLPVRAVRERTAPAILLLDGDGPLAQVLKLLVELRARFGG